jgi:putative restriction endonuclease
MRITPHLEEILFTLRVGVTGTGRNRHERPHKPVLLLAMLDLIARDSGPGRGDRTVVVPWSQDLRERFRAYFEIVRSGDDGCSPDLPFYHLKTDDIGWSPKRTASGSTAETALGGPPTVADIGAIFGVFDGEMASVILDPDGRSRIRALLVSRYFPMHRRALEPLFKDLPIPEPGTTTDPRVREDGSEAEAVADSVISPGRSAAFARIVREAYDFQCAACGLRIRLEDNLTFIDAAHLIPFGQSFNDHPTNGIALCKNHHWAMDRNLLAPTTGGIWKVAASRLLAHRSPGEAEILTLAGRQILIPRDEAYWPDPEALRWREMRVG